MGRKIESILPVTIGEEINIAAERLVNPGKKEQLPWIMESRSVAIIEHNLS